MQTKIRTLAVLWLTSIFLLSACSGPAAPKAAPLIPGLAQTMAAQTLTAQQGVYSPFLITPTQAAAHPLTAAQEPVNPVPASPLATRTPLAGETPSREPVKARKESESCYNAAEFVTDVSIPDNTVLKPNQQFTKTWRFKNTGTCTWTADYAVVFVDGEKMSELEAVSLGRTVAPGESVNISVALTAPGDENCYRSSWMFQDGEGNQFGTGEERDNSFWVDVSVTEGEKGFGGLASLGGG